MDFVRRQTAKTAADPNARIKQLAYVVILLVITSGIPKAESSAALCGPCLSGAGQICSSLFTAGGICYSVAAFPPALCVCLLANGGILCAISIGICVSVCLAPIP